MDDFKFYTENPFSYSKQEKKKHVQIAKRKRVSDRGKWRGGEKEIERKEWGEEGREMGSNQKSNLKRNPRPRQNLNFLQRKPNAID